MAIDRMEVPVQLAVAGENFVGLVIESGAPLIVIQSSSAVLYRIRLNSLHLHFDFNFFMQEERKVHWIVLKERPAVRLVVRFFLPICNVSGTSVVPARGQH